MNKTQISEIADLIEIQFSGSKGRLEKVAIRERKLLSLIGELSKNISSDSSHVGISTPSVIEFRNDVLLRRWVDKRRASVNIELAQVRTLKVMEQDKLRHIFSRKTALKRIQDKQLSRERIKSRRHDGHGI